MLVAWGGRTAVNRPLGAAQTTDGHSCRASLSPCPSRAWRSQCQHASPSPWLIPASHSWGWWGGGSCMLPAGPGSAGQRVPCAWASPDRRPHCMARGQPAAARRRAVPGLSQGATVAGAGAEPCPVTPSWRQRWTWPSGAASARPSGSCSGRSWSGTRKRWHPSVFAQSVAVTDRTTRRTGLGESGLGLGSRAPPAFAPGDGSFEAQPCCGLDRFGFVRGWEQPGTEQLGA